MTNSDEAQPRKRGKLGQALRYVAITFGLTLLLFILLEGVSSTVLLVWRLGRAVEDRAGMDWRHTRHDEDLGWAHQPNIAIEDIYGPGNNLTTNSQGFRADHDFEPEEPEGTVRVVCSGDSFTLGYGVDDADTWCAKLAGLDPRLETVNMGQVAYGVGQMYLWYMRDGRPLEHSVHVLGVISVDFERMMRDDFLGVPKPRLVVEDGELVATNVPVPPPGKQINRVEIEEQINDLRVVEASRALLRRLPSVGGPSVEADMAAAAEGAGADLVSAILDSLVAVNTSKNSTFVIAYIPVRSDMARKIPDRSARWLRHLIREAEKRGILLVDLIGEFATHSPGEIATMYIPRQDVGRAHLSAYGNTVAARAIYERLKSVPELSERLAGPPLQPTASR